MKKQLRAYVLVLVVCAALALADFRLHQPRYDPAGPPLTFERGSIIEDMGVSAIFQGSDLLVQTTWHSILQPGDTLASLRAKMGHEHGTFTDNVRRYIWQVELRPEDKEIRQITEWRYLMLTIDSDQKVTWIQPLLVLPDGFQDRDVGSPSPSKGGYKPAQ